jgi:hypothetical protein
MTQLIVFSCIFLALLCLLALTVYRYRHFHEDQTGEVAARLPVDFLIPRRSGEFAEGLKNLANLESEIRQNGFFAAGRWSLVRERNKIAGELIAALREDFYRLDHLMCALAAVSPEIDRQREAERLWLSLRFTVRYRLALLTLSLGALPTDSIPRLQALIKGRARDLRTLLKGVDSTMSLHVGARQVN